MLNDIKHLKINNIYSGKLLWPSKSPEKQAEF